MPALTGWLLPWLAMTLAYRSPCVSALLYETMNEAMLNGSNMLTTNPDRMNWPYIACHESTVVHTSIYNKSYVWTTLMNHMTCSDDEIYRLSGVNLVYLDETTYGIIRKIHAPQLDTTKPTPKLRGRTSKKIKKVTCRDSFPWPKTRQQHQ